MSPLGRAVVIGGSGSVGALVVEQLVQDGHGVTVLDSMASRAPRPGVTYIRMDVAPELAPEYMSVLSHADIVVLAVPENVAMACAATVWNAMGDDSLLVETCSVKSRISAVLADLPVAGASSILGINPMFAPSLGFAGRPVAAVEHRPGVGSSSFLAGLVRWGARTVPVTADRHDHLAASVQALTHASVFAFGLALGSLEADSIDVAPPPHLTALALLARVTEGTPEVYWDVQVGNPFAHNARAALSRAMDEFADVSDRGSLPEFAQLMQRAGEPLGARSAEFASLCADLFGIVGVRRSTALGGDQRAPDGDPS